MLAALNHPNIAAIHGIEEADGIQALVLEFVDGPTLADRIARGPIPLDEALPIAAEIAEALEAAHEQGIVHRDLKPANIKVRPDGTVKVLDFGLAKFTGSPETEGLASDTASPTLTSPALMTGAGVLLGTAAYMSPEQAKGRPADARSDIWAFGCVLYEMLSGRRPFNGDGALDLLSAVARVEPTWSVLPQSLPASVRMLVETCLAKDRKKRTVDATTARFVLGHVDVHGEPQAVSGIRRLVGSRVALATVAAGVVTGGIAAGAGLLFMFRQPPAVITTEVTTPSEAPLEVSGADRDFAITPDGNRVVYRTPNALVVRALNQLEPAILRGVGVPRGVFVSPDSQWIGYFDTLASQLKRVSVTGGTPITVADVGTGGPRGATWGSDGTIVYATANQTTGLQAVPAVGGEPTVLTRPDQGKGEADHLWPEFLPDRRAVLFTIATGASSGGRLESGDVAVFELDAGTYRTLIRGGSHAHYVPSGHLIYGSEGTVRAVPFDRDSLSVTGTAVPVLERVLTAATGAVELSVSATGTLAYVVGAYSAGTPRSLVWVDRMGHEEALAAPPRAYYYPRISPDGTRVALDARDQEYDIWIWDVVRRTMTRFTFGSANDEYPVWTPDGKRIVYGSGPFTTQNLFVQAADGSGRPERLTTSEKGQDPQTITHDGRAVIFREFAESGGNTDLALLSLAPPGRTPQLLLNTRFDERSAAMSPDGRWLAYDSNESGQTEIYVRPYPRVDAGRWQVSSGGGRTPAWSRDGGELFFLAPDDVLMGVTVEAATSWGNTAPAPIISGAYFFGTPGLGRTYDVAPDGRFLMLKLAGADSSESRNIVVVQHWLEELKRLVP